MTKKTLSPALLKKLSLAAKKARDNGYAPYSGHYLVGAALLTDKGKIYAGCNCENANYKSSCAERSAICAMVSAGGRRITDIAVISLDPAYITPCGSCRQDIREFGNAETRIHCLHADGKLARSFTLGELLPHSFGPENLGQTSTAHPKKKKK